MYNLSDPSLLKGDLLIDYTGFEARVKLNHGISDEDFSKEVIRDIIENIKVLRNRTVLFFVFILFSNSTNF